MLLQSYLDSGQRILKIVDSMTALTGAKTKRQFWIFQWILQFRLLPCPSSGNADHILRQNLGEGQTVFEPWKIRIRNLYHFQDIGAQTCLLKYDHILPWKSAKSWNSLEDVTFSF